MNFYMKCQANENIFLNNMEFAALHVTGNIFVRSTAQIQSVSATFTGRILPDLAHFPVSSENSCSSIIFIPSCLAFSSFDPAFSPAST